MAFSILSAIVAFVLVSEDISIAKQISWSLAKASRQASLNPINSGAAASGH